MALAPTAVKHQLTPHHSLYREKRGDGAEQRPQVAPQAVILWRYASTTSEAWRRAEDNDYRNADKSTSKSTSLGVIPYRRHPAPNSGVGQETDVEMVQRGWLRKIFQSVLLFHSPGERDCRVHLFEALSTRPWNRWRTVDGNYHQLGRQDETGSTNRFIKSLRTTRGTDRSGFGCPLPHLAAPSGPATRTARAVWLTGSTTPQEMPAATTRTRHRSADASRPVPPERRAAPEPPQGYSNV
jgi:hypothetical protein